jgi:hypothetical protein
MPLGDAHTGRHRTSVTLTMPSPQRFSAAIAVVALVLGAGLAVFPAKAQDIIAYPSKGQSSDKQNQDRYECHRWAVQQSGFDPSQPVSQAASPPPPTQPRQGGLLPGAVKGAAVGAVGGAIAGNAGKGAAIGAGTGALIGGLRRADQNRQQQASQQQYAQAQSSANSQQRNNYNRALGACMQGRGYAVN